MLIPSTEALLIDALVLAAVLAVLVVAWSTLTAWRRDRSLARLDPPTAKELEAVRELRLAGAFRLPGRASAVARHFELPQQPAEGASRGGRGCYEPDLIESWRDRRSAN